MCLDHLNILLIILMTTEKAYGLRNGLILSKYPDLDAQITYVVRLSLLKKLGPTYKYRGNTISTGFCFDESWVVGGGVFVHAAMKKKMALDIEVCLDHRVTDKFECNSPLLLRNVISALVNIQSNVSYETNDKRLVALLKLDKNYDITPARLFKAHIDASLINRNIFKNCIILGWGAISHGNTTYPVYTYTKGLRYTHIKTFGVCPLADKTNLFCFHIPNVALCEGDMSAPMVCDGLLIGIYTTVYHNRKCGLEDVVVVVEQIFLYIDWIQQTIVKYERNVENPTGNGASCMKIKQMVYIKIILNIFIFFKLSFI